MIPKRPGNQSAKQSITTKKVAMNKTKRVKKLQAKIRRLDRYHYDTIDDYRKGDNVDFKKLHKSIKYTDKLRENLKKMGCEIPKNPRILK